jgi:hypothetical protein
MRRAVGLAAAAWLAVLGAGPAAAAPKLGAADEAAVLQVFERGTLLYAYDQAAWHGTDDLVKKLPDYAQKVGGWIVDGPAEAPTLIFFDRDAADPKALYVADFRGGTLASAKVLGPADDRALNAQRKRLIAARAAAVARFEKANMQRCSDQAFNTVVLPPAAAGGAILVYLLTPQKSLDSLPFGGHYRIEVGLDGKAGEPRRFTNSCLEMPLPRAGDEKLEALGVSHLLDPLPTEIHVFAMHVAKLPVMVGAAKKKRVFMVEPGGIRLIGKMR